MEFLTDAQVAAYGRFEGVPSRADLERFFFLDDAGKSLIGDRRGDHNRLGFMLQATTVRFVGLFLEDPLEVPWPVVEYLAGQLEIDASCVKRYTERPKTVYEHAWEIRQAYGFRVFEDEQVTVEFRRFLDGRAWTHAQGPVTTPCQTPLRCDTDHCRHVADVDPLRPYPSAIPDSYPSVTLAPWDAYPSAWPKWGPLPPRCWT